MDPWTAVTVKTVESDNGSGYRAVPSSDLLSGMIVTFGDAKFDTKAGGGGVTREALADFSFHIGDPSFPLPVIGAKPATTPVLDGVDGSDASWSKDYKARKPSLIKKASSIDPERKKVLADTYFDSYESFFQLRCPTKPVKLKNVLFGKTVSGVLTKLDSPASSKYDWTVQLAFYRFDGDTLTGICDGSLLAEHQ